MPAAPFAVADLGVDTGVPPDDTWTPVKIGKLGAERQMKVP